jgi:hypothetical protein
MSMLEDDYILCHAKTKTEKNNNVEVLWIRPNIMDGTQKRFQKRIWIPGINGTFTFRYSFVNFSFIHFIQSFW